MRILFVLLCIIFQLPLSAQIQLRGYNQEKIDPALLEGRWKAHWIACPDMSQEEYGVCHFRKSVELSAVPSRFVVHVSADNRYKLYVNGELVSLGPARGDIYNWNFETVDLAPYLRSGKNTLAAVVWNYAQWKPFAQMSYGQTGFILQGNTDVEACVNTDTSWVCLPDQAYSPWMDWGVQGYFVVGPGEGIDASRYPWGWEMPGYDDKDWKNALQGMDGAVKGARDYAGRLLVPSPIPPMELKMERLSEVRLSEGIVCPEGFPHAAKPLTIPANSEIRLLLDNEVLTTGYFSLAFSGGKGADIRIGYAEALYSQETKKGAKPYVFLSKGNRNDPEGKDFIGYGDRILPDGGDDRLFTSLWWRTWRYVELKVKTASDPLVIGDIYGTFTAYPFQREAEFSAPGHEDLERMLDIGWRTARLCANETYMDCPYYEQLQYFGDTRIQAMISLYNTRDSFMVKNALEKGRQSMVGEGITMSRYPSYVHQFISSFSLWWICMGHDYWMYRGDEDYLRTLLPAYRQVLSWYEQWLKPNNSLDYVPHWFFMDWAAGLDYGEPIREKDGDSAFQDLLFVKTLQYVAEMEQAFGIPALAERYREMASGIREAIRRNYWDEKRGLFADTPERRSFSQHVNALAILTGVTKGEEAKSVMMRTLEDKSLIQCTIYFRYYLSRAMKAAGLGDLLLDNLQVWSDQMALGLTTWAEQPEPSRSDCHAWGASLNVEFFRIVLGVDSETPGFRKIRIEPSLGELKKVSGTIPHPLGNISVAYTLDDKKEGSAQISLPQGTSGTFVWKGKEIPLHEGEQTIVLTGY